MDPEQLSQTYSYTKEVHQPFVTSGPKWLKYLRSFQLITTIVALVLVACAMDRNALVPGITAEEYALLASAIVAQIVLIYHNLVAYKKPYVPIVDGFAAAFLLATFSFGAFQASQDGGACYAPPSKPSAWNHRRGCERMTLATGFTAASFVGFASSAVISLLA